MVKVRGAPKWGTSIQGDVTLVELETDALWLQDTLDNLILRLEVIRASVPAEFRDRVEVDVQADWDYGGSELLFDISYERPATPDEIRAAQAKESAEEAQRRLLSLAAERRQYEALRKKFESEDE